MNDNESFEYTYSAPEQEEVKRIREKYMPREERESKLDQLRRLDESVTKKANCWSIVLGTISCLIMGGGMSMCMVQTNYFIPGVVIGIVGMAGVALAFPLYRHIVRKERARIAPQILKLTDELMQ